MYALILMDVYTELVLNHYWLIGSLIMLLLFPNLRLIADDNKTNTIS